MADGYDSIGQDTATGQWYGKSNGQWAKITSLDAARKMHTTTPAPVAPAAPSTPSALNRFVTSAVGVPEGTTIPDVLSRTKQDFTDPKAAIADLTEGFRRLNPLAASRNAAQTGITLARQPGMVNKAAGATETALSGVPFVGPAITGAMEQARRGDFAGSAGTVSQLTAAALVDPQARAAVKDAAGMIPKAAARVGKELVGSGPSMERLQAAKDLNALPLKASLGKLADSARTDASSLIELAVTKMDADHPEGVVPKAELGPKVDNIVKDFVKIEEKPPQSIPQITAAPQSELAQASVFRGPSSAAVGDVASALKNRNITEAGRQRLNNFLEQLGEAPIADEGTVGEGWSARQIQQLRTKLYNAAYGSKGSAISGGMRQAAGKVYGVLSDTLSDAARDSNVYGAWNAGNQKWANYKQTFDGKWERNQFHESPISRAMSGQTADEIMEPLSGKNAQYTRDLLHRYAQFGSDTAELARLMSRHNWLSTIERFSHPSKYEMMATPIAAINPTFFARMAATRFLTPPILRWLATRGINPENVRGLPPVIPGPPQ